MREKLVSGFFFFDMISCRLRIDVHLGFMIFRASTFPCCWLYITDILTVPTKKDLGFTLVLKDVQNNSSFHS